MLSIVSHMGNLIQWFLCFTSYLLIQLAYYFLLSIILGSALEVFLLIGSQIVLPFEPFSCYSMPVICLHPCLFYPLLFGISLYWHLHSYKVSSIYVGSLENLYSSCLVLPFPFPVSWNTYIYGASFL